MNLRTNILGALLFLTSLSITAQNIALPTEYISNTHSGKNIVPEKVQGSQYINETFQKGKVTIGDKSFPSSIRYNGYQDLFEIRNEYGEITSLQRRPGILVTMGGDTYEIQPYLKNGKKTQGYFQHLTTPDSRTKLLLKQTVVLNEGRKARNTYGNDKPATLKPENSYYLKLDNTSAEEIRLRRRDILKVLDNEKIKDYVKENKMRLKEEAEVIQVLEYYDSL